LVWSSGAKPLRENKAKVRSVAPVILKGLEVDPVDELHA